MKANAPEKIYLCKVHKSDQFDSRWWSEKASDKDIEYIRKDAFIEKACDAYCAICDTKECGGTGECVWVENFRKRLIK